MTDLLDLPDELFLNYILQYLTAADLWRLWAVCRKLNNDESVVQHEVRQRDSTLIESKQYPPESPIMSVFEHYERVLCFERCSAFAWEMTRQAQQHETLGFRCKESGCKYPDLHAAVPELEDGLRNGKHYFFFAQFTSRDKVLWEGFLKDYDSESDFTNPMDKLNEELVGELNAVSQEFCDDFVETSDVHFHLDADNVSNLTKDNVNSYLYVTLVSLTYSQEQPELLPELHLHYSSQGVRLQYPPTHSPGHSSPFMDALRDQYVTTHHHGNEYYATPCLLWKSRARLHSFSMVYHDDAVELYYDDNTNGGHNTYDDYTYEDDAFYDYDDWANYFQESPWRL